MSKLKIAGYVRISVDIEKDTTNNIEEALLEVYKKQRPGEPPVLENAQNHLYGLFFDTRRYDMSRVGRYKYNKKLNLAYRLPGCRVADPVINPETGEVIAEAGERPDGAGGQATDPAVWFGGWSAPGSGEDRRKAGSDPGRAVPASHRHRKLLQ